MFEIDKTSLLVTTDTDIEIATLERQLNREGWTLNYFAPPNNKFLLADALSERLPNLYGEAFGGIEDLCLQIKLSQTDHRIFTHVPTPRSATGPSFKKIAIGAKTTLGIPIEATMRIFFAPALKVVGAMVFNEAKARDHFLRLYQRLSIKLPLLCSLPSPSVIKFFPHVAEGQLVLVFALWGEGLIVKSHVDFFKNQTGARAGELILVNDEEAREALIKMLHKECVHIFEQKQKMRPPLDPSHEDLARRLQGAL